MKRKFVINPASGGGLSSSGIGELRSFFEKRGESFDSILTKDREDTIQRTREALRNGYEQIVAVGGDGTVNAVVNGFFDSGVPIRPEARLAVAQMGSGSDYFRSITHQAHRDWKEIVLEHECRSVDLGKVRFLSGGGDPLFFINMAGVGMSAAVVRGKERLPGWVPRKLSYLIPTIEQLALRRGAPARVSIDGGSPAEIDLMGAFISKGAYAGGGMRFASTDALDSGFLEVTLVSSGVGFTDLLTALPRLYTGKIEVKGVEKHRAKTLRIESPSPIDAEFDGELLGSTGLEIGLLERGIRVCF